MSVRLFGDTKTSMATQLDLSMDQGADFANVLAVTDASGSVLNLTGYTVASKMRRSPLSKASIQIIAVVTNPTGGLIKLSLPNSETATIFPTRWVYDVIMTNTSSGIKTTIYQGQLFVNPGVTNNADNLALGTDNEEDWGHL